MQKKKRRNAKSKYSPAVVRAVLYAVRTASQTLAQIAAKYGLPKGSGSMISKWVKKYSSDFFSMEDLQRKISDTNHLELAAKSSGENELQKQPEEARRKIICLETMIDIAERKIGVDIQKNWYQTVRFVKTHYAPGSLQELYELFGKKRQVFYGGGWRKEKESVEAALVLAEVALIRKELPKAGIRKLQYLLKDFFAQHGIKMGPDALFSLLMAEGLLVKKHKRKVSTTNSRHRVRKYPNLVRDVELVRAEQVWVSDITYIALQKSFCYLSLITDAYFKKIVGYNLEATLETDGCVKALAMALNTRAKPAKHGLIHHSDRGIQYCSSAYVGLLLSSHISISMTEKSDPYENAVAERLNGILKDEFSLGRTFQNIHQAHSVVQESITIYNSKRPHSSIGYLTPDKAHIETSA